MEACKPYVGFGNYSKDNGEKGWWEGKHCNREGSQDEGLVHFSFFLLIVCS